MLELEQTEGHAAARAAAGHEVLETPGQPDQELLRRLEVALRRLELEPTEGSAAARAAAGHEVLGTPAEAEDGGRGPCRGARCCRASVSGSPWAARPGAAARA